MDRADRSRTQLLVVDDDSAMRDFLSESLMDEGYRVDVAAGGRSGVGIPVADRERIFEPFYTTKQGESKEGGTGLGLAVSVGIVKDHDGWMEIDSRPGGGTIFRVFLPASEAAELAASAAV